MQLNDLKAGSYEYKVALNDNWVSGRWYIYLNPPTHHTHTNTHTHTAACQWRLNPWWWCKDMYLDRSYYHRTITMDWERNSSGPTSRLGQPVITSPSPCSLIGVMVMSPIHWLMYSWLLHHLTIGTRQDSPTGCRWIIEHDYISSHPCEYWIFYKWLPHSTSLKWQDFEGIGIYVTAIELNEGEHFYVVGRFQVFPLVASHLLYSVWILNCI